MWLFCDVACVEITIAVIETGIMIVVTGVNCIYMFEIIMHLIPTCICIYLGITIVVIITEMIAEEGAEIAAIEIDEIAVAPEAMVDPMINYTSHEKYILLFPSHFLLINIFIYILIFLFCTTCYYYLKSPNVYT